MADFGFERFQVQQQLMAMPEHQRLRKLDELSTSIWVFEQNYRELLTLINQTLSLEASLPLTVRKNRMLFEFSIYELTRLLHNFVTSGRLAGRSHSENLSYALRQTGIASGISSASR